MVSKYIGGYEREREWLLSCSRGRTEEVKAMRNLLRRVACLLSGAMVMSGPGLLPRPMSGSMALLQPLSVLVSVVSVTTESQEERAAESWPCPH